MKKSVSFNERQNKVHLLVVYDFAYREARKSDWEKAYLDKLRFKQRIKECENVLANVINNKMSIFKENKTRI